MSALLKIAVVHVVALFAALLLAFGAADSLLSGSSQELVSSASTVVLLTLYVSFWLWMLVDHIFKGRSPHTVLVGLLLVLGGGIAAVIYFFTVFLPHELRSPSRRVAGA